MDQAKTNLPRFHNVTKADCKLSKMHHHLTGVLCNSGVLHPYAFTWTDQFAPDADVTINCFMRVLDDISKKRNGSLPPTLYVQADNCAKDNKNNYVLMFLCQLVKAKIFKKVKMSFLMVGHTHEDIDQIFSRISSKLNRTNAQTLPKLHQAIQESFQPIPAVEHLQSLWHFKGQYQGLPKLTGIKCPHVFKFKLGPDDLVHASIKDWPLSEEAYRTIIVPHIPDFPNILNIIEPRREKVLPILRSLQLDIPKYKSAGRLGEDDALWWTTYLEGIELNERRVPSIPLPGILPKFREDARPRPSILDSSLRDALNQQILKLQHVSVLTLSRQRISL